jgi:hypothetical protein
LEDIEIKEIIIKKQSDNKMSCKTALEIADNAGVSRRKIGDLINELKIKIHSCQLGCFK